MIVHSLKVKKDLFCPKKDYEKTLGPEVPYYSVSGVLMNLVNYTWPNIAFFVNLLMRYSSTPIQRHWNKNNHVLQ